MPAFAIAMAVLVVAFDRVVETKYGTIGVAGLTLMIIGIKAKNATCSIAGGAMLASVISQPTG
ncbi:hypothetical protein SRB5_65170 [Streptomyces sp. RB5]|uniref:Uncharacterized protein n=1 Tax=Streptomyces smaragdinus TaxID=2585196 RepID=A0A7K0CS75_9ACTN|nr:hypothetical protein [Streptomyces smaragdinus]MQY16319.1 hypothetical protein [Streptomyces smaragdinus]